jgi:AcrR family transcriptional regulator
MASETGRVRQPRADGLRTRSAILLEAVSLATVDGLEGLSIGSLAKATGISKSGVYAHFGSKEELQLATVDVAGRIFKREVIAPALDRDPGLDQLLTVCDSFFEYLRRQIFPGGCFFAGAVLEMGSRPGPVKERVAEFQRLFIELLRQFAETAKLLGQLPSDEDVAMLTFELNGIILATDANFVMNNDPTILQVARRVVRRRLSVGDIRATDLL